MQVKFYTDEHISRAVISGMRHRGVDVLSTPEANMRGSSDEEHLALARQLNRVLVTQDTDFIRLHDMGAAHAGIVFVNRHMKIGEIVHGLAVIHSLFDAESMYGHLEFL